MEIRSIQTLLKYDLRQSQLFTYIVDIIVCSISNREMIPRAIYCILLGNHNVFLDS